MIATLAFLLVFIAAGTSSCETSSPAAALTPPYPQSQFVSSLTWDSLSHLQTLPSDGDNWPATWADDGKLYTSYGDGTGFGGSNTLSLGLSSVTGDPFSGTMHGSNFGSNIDATGNGNTGIKASGLLMVNGTLYVFVRNYKVGVDWHHARLAKSTDHGRTWTWANWDFSNTFGVPDFVQYGQNYQGGDPNFVYIASQDNNNAYTRSPNIVLARVPKNQVDNLSAYTFFSGTSTNPQWSKDMTQRTSIFYDPNGTQRIAMSYNSALKRYFLVTSHDDGSHATHTNALGVFDAPVPWGPWATDYYSNTWSVGESHEQRFPPKYISSDGKTMWMLFSGQNGTPYKFDLRKASLTITPPP